MVEGFLLVMLERWNGLDYKKEIFRLLSHLSLQPFQGTHLPCVCVYVCVCMRVCIHVCTITV